MEPGFLTSAFAAATAAVGTAAPIIAAGLGLAWWKMVKMLKPDTQKAYIVTGHKFPQFSLKKEQFVVRNAPQRYFTPWSSKPEEVNLNSFAVQIDRMASDKSALTLKDYVKAEVEVVFYVRVDKSNDANIIQAKQSLGEITEKSIRTFLEAKFDSALRDAAATMDLEEVQGDREKFLTNVKEALNLKPFGLELTDVALRRLNQAPKEAFNENDSFDAQGLKKVTEIIEGSKKIRNDTVQQNATLIAGRNKDEEIRRLTIKQEERKAQLDQEQAVKEMEALQNKQVAEIQAENTKLARMAAIKAEEETGRREIEKNRQLGIADQERQQQIAVAKAKQEQEAQLADRNKEIALAAKEREQAAAQKAANEARADSVAAEQSVITAKEVAEAERAKQIAIIEAEKQAGQDQASKKIDADTKVYVAQKGAEAMKTEAEGTAQALKIEAQAQADAAAKHAEGEYQTIFQKKKAEADGDAARAEAQRKLNEAQNVMSDAVRDYLIQLKRAEITPEVVAKLTESIKQIGNFNVVSMDGVPYPGGGSGAVPSGSGGGATSGNVIDQAYNAMLRLGFDRAIVEQVVTAIGGDGKVASFLPDMGRPVATPASPAAPFAAASTPAAIPPAGNTNEKPQVPAVVERKPKTAGGGAPSPI